jgi:hypothetical protein
MSGADYSQPGRAGNTTPAKLVKEAAFLQEALAIASFEPGVYEVVRTFTPAGGSGAGLRFGQPPSKH